MLRSGGPRTKCPAAKKGPPKKKKDMCFFHAFGKKGGQKDGRRAVNIEAHRKPGEQFNFGTQCSR